MSHVNATTFTIVVALFILVTGIGFAASRWRTARDMMQLNEWGLAGRGFGTFITWFLLGGDLYTAYTFIAVPALVYASGFIGFYVAAYTIMAYPIAFIFLPRLWSVSRVHNYVTPADFIRGRYGSRGLALSAAVTGILASLPYIALQLVGIQAVLSVMGVGSTSTNTYLRDLPLFIAFIVLPAYSVLLALIALFGYMAIADPVTVANVKKTGNSQLAVPYLLQHMFPSWFTGVAFAGIIIGALVPAAIMSIGAANLFTRNIFREFFKPDASPRLETQVSRWTSLVVKLGALYFAVELPQPEGTDETLPHQYTADPEQAPAPVLADAGVQDSATPATGAAGD